jgi:predicted Zn-dependent protease
MARSARAKAGSRVRAAVLRFHWTLGLVVCVVLAAGSGAWLLVVQPRREREEALHLSAQDRFVAAEPLLKRALGRNAGDAAVARALALGYLAGGNERAAEAYLDRWCDLQPDQAEPHARRMELAMKWARVGQAIADGERLLAIKPGDVEMQMRVAGLLLVANRYREAEAACRRFLGQNPEAAGLRYLLAEACHLQGKGGEAVALLDPLLKDEPPLEGVLLLRATLYCDAGQPDKAIPLLRRVVAQDPWHPTARYELSRALGRTGQTAEAEREAAELYRQNEAVRLLADSRAQPDNLELRARAAEMLQGIGGPTQGIRRLGEILDRYPVNRPPSSCWPPSRRLKGR